MPERPGLADLTDLCTPWCVHVVATLRIAEHIASGVEGLDGLANATGCDAHALGCVLRHLVRKGVFQQVGPERFALNDTARELLDPSMRLVLDLDGIGGRIAHAWGTLLQVVRTGRPAYHERFGRPFWEDLEAHPEIAAGFDALMGPVGHGPPDPEVLLAGDWEGVRSVVDVGGGTGALLAEILRARPEVQGVLVELPRAVALAEETFRTAGVADRASTVAQSFFDPLPPGADLYVLEKVLNDWPDRETRAILRRCAEAARPCGRVVVLGGVTPDESPRTLEAELVLVGGRSNALAEFRNLAGDAGLEVSAAGTQPSGRFVVECRPTG